MSTTRKTPSKVEWVDGPPGRRGIVGRFAPFMDELRQRPGEWARTPMGETRAAPQISGGFEFKLRTIDGVRWLYGRFNAPSNGVGT